MVVKLTLHAFLYSWMYPINKKGITVIISCQTLCGSINGFCIKPRNDAVTLYFTYICNNYLHNYFITVAQIRSRTKAILMYKKLSTTQQMQLIINFKMRYRKDETCTCMSYHILYLYMHVNIWLMQSYGTPKLSYEVLVWIRCS